MIKDFSGALDGSPYNSRQIQIIAITSVLVFLSTLALGLRLWARKLIGVGLYTDDYVITAGLLLSYGNCVCQYVGVSFGLGRHIDEVGEYNGSRYLLVLFVLQMFWNTTLPVIKLAISLFYMRIFPVKSMKIACKIINWYLLLWFITFQTTAIFQCTPVSYFWNRATENGHCIASTSFFIALATTNLFTDVALLLMPIPSIWKLSVRTPQKIRLSSIFLVGTFVCVIAIVRIQTLTVIDDTDITYSNSFAGLFTAIESSIGVVVACMPSLMPIWNMLLGKPPTASDTTVNSHQVRTYQSRVDTDNTGWEMISDVGGKRNVIAVRDEWDVREEMTSTTQSA